MFKVQCAVSEISGYENKKGFERRQREGSLPDMHIIEKDEICEKIRHANVMTVMSGTCTRHYELRGLPN